MSPLDLAVLLVTIAMPLALCALAWHAYLERRALQRYERILRERNERVPEDIAWRFRARDVALAQRIESYKVADKILAQINERRRVA